jgi:hypothetical protein
MIKDQMDKKFGSPWHVIVGKAFAYEITYEVSGNGAGTHVLGMQPVQHTRLHIQAVSSSSPLSTSSIRSASAITQLKSYCSNPGRQPECSCAVLPAALTHHAQRTVVTVCMASSCCVLCCLQLRNILYLYVGGTTGVLLWKM